MMLPEPKLVDMDTGEVRKDRRTGVTVYTVGVCAMRGRDSSVIQVSVVGEPHGLMLGAPVELVELEAAPWDRDGRSGVAWRAGAVNPANPGNPSNPSGRRPAGATAGPATASGAGGAGSARPGEAG